MFNNAGARSACGLGASGGLVPLARDRTDNSVGVDLPDPVVPSVGEVRVARGVKGDALRVIEACRRCRARVAIETTGARSSPSVDDAVRSHFANNVRGWLGNLKVACRIHRDAR